MNICVSINTNHAYNDTFIEEGAIYEFTTTGFAEGIYDATVSFCCLPAAVDGNALEVIIDNVMEFADFGEAVVFYGKLCKYIITFLKKCHGYVKSVIVQLVTGEEEMIDVSDDMSDIELQAKVIAILKEEQEKTSRDVSDMICH